MTNENMESELVQALNNIHMELKRMNLSLSLIAGKQQASEPQGRPPGISSGRVGRPAGAAGRVTRSSYDRSPSRSAGPGAPSTDGGSRFPRKSSSAPRPKGKPPVKKGDGYPKKPR